MRFLSALLCLVAATPVFADEPIARHEIPRAELDVVVRITSWLQFALAPSAPMGIQTVFMSCAYEHSLQQLAAMVKADIELNKQEATDANLQKSFSLICLRSKILKPVG